MNDATARHKTRASLIGSGLHLFGQKGFEGTSTRELAGHAGTNVASISYHFGGKAGLREACAREVAEQVSRTLGTLGEGKGRDTGLPDSPITPEEARREIERMAGAFVQLIVGTPQARDMVAFMLRELTGPGDIAQSIYEEFVEPRHRQMCGLWAIATGRSCEDEALKLAIFALIGQIVYFRAAAPFVARRLDWASIGPDETRQVKDTVIAGLRDALERLTL